VKADAIPQLKAVLRTRRGIRTLAIFINGYNVWDLQPKQWTGEVQQAVLHAYNLGAEHAKRSSINAVYSMSPQLDPCAKWPDVVVEDKL